MRRYIFSKNILAQKLQQCYICHKNFNEDDMEKIQDQNGQNVFVCVDCFNEHAQQCDNCSQWILNCDDNKIGDIFVCQQCRQGYIQCENCGTYFNIQNEGGSVHDSNYCQDCFDQIAYYCDNCGQVGYYEDMIETYDRNERRIYVCEDCKSKFIQQCCLCNDDINIYDNEYGYILDDGELVCQSCFQSHCGYCSDCGQVCLNDDLEIGDDGQFYCRTCIDDHTKIQIDPQVDENNIVYPYGKKIKINQKKTDTQQDTDQYIGVQLQIRSQNKSQQDIDKFVQVVSKNKNIIFKQDGSIGMGVQIVTQPCTYNFHKHGFGWQRIFHYMKQYNMINTDNCGLHFHISKNNFTKDQQKCLDYFVNNATKFLSQIGGRDYSTSADGQYCKAIKKQQNQYGKNYDSRYQAVNFYNTNTVQLRFFKSTNSFGEFRKRLGTVHNLCKLAKFFTFDDLKTLDETDLKNCFYQIIQNVY